MSFLILSGTGTPLWAPVLLGLTLDFASDFSDLAFRESLGDSVSFTCDFLPGLTSLLADFVLTDELLSLRALDFLNAGLCLGFSGALDFRGAGLMTGFSSGGGDRRRRIRGGVCASVVCRDNNAALLNSCPQSQRCSTSIVPIRTKRIYILEYYYIHMEIYKDLL